MIYKISLPNFKYGHLMPMEDCEQSMANIFAVADGVTRDPSENMDFTKRTFEEILKNYPNPSGAKMAADIFCDTFVISIQKEQDLKKSFIVANQAIAELNRKYVPKVDYLVNDYYACVASGGIIKDNKLFWGVIGDCGVIIYNKDGRIKLRTPNTYSIFEQYVKQEKIKFKWELPEGRRYVRSEFRNKPNKFIDKVRVSFGALTGEKEAEEFVYVGEYNIENGDLIIFYTDGFKPHLENSDFFTAIYQDDELIASEKFKDLDTKLINKDPDKYGKERTLIAVRI